MTVDELLDLIDETLEEGTSVPFSGGKRMVDVEKMQEILDEIRLNLPTELRQAKAIVNDRADIVNGARKEAEAIVAKAEERARVLVSEESVVKAAQTRAAEIVSTAQTQARELRAKTIEYCDNMLRATFEQLTRSAAEVKGVRENLRQVGRG
ncbi:MAG: ATPase [Oscillospiraceae bacterium]|nr:ATPase [Oscillospiraceae bacterium]